MARASLPPAFRGDSVEDAAQTRARQVIPTHKFVFGDVIRQVARQPIGGDRKIDLLVLGCGQSICAILLFWGLDEEKALIRLFLHEFLFGKVPQGGTYRAARGATTFL